MMIGLGAVPDFCGSANREGIGKAVHREPDAEENGGEAVYFFLEDRE